MSGVPNMPNVPAGAGELQRKAAQLRAEREAQAASRPAAPPAQAATQPPAVPTSEAGPVGQGEYVVKSGDCVSSIAKAHGHFWETIWNHPANSELREARRDPNVLLPRDRVVLPTKQPKTEAGQTEMRHRFVRRGEPAKLVLRASDQNGPRANQPYRLVVDGVERTGVTDANGMIREPIPGNARQATLWVGQAGKQRQYVLKLGHLDPVETTRGVQARLNNLGFACGPVDGIPGPRTQAAISRFQESVGLAVSGEADEPTRGRIKQAHGS